jgi:hypothetical protein
MIGLGLVLGWAGICVSVWDAQILMAGRVDRSRDEYDGLGCLRGLRNRS